MQGLERHGIARRHVQLERHRAVADRIEDVGPLALPEQVLAGVEARVRRAARDQLELALRRAR